MKILHAFSWLVLLLVVGPWLTACSSTRTPATPPWAEWGKAAVHLDVVYSDLGLTKLQMDVAVPHGQGPFPAIVMFPGGVTEQDPRQNLHSAMKFFVWHGYTVAAVQYRGPAAGKFPAQIDDAKNAVRFLRARAAEYRVDPQRVGAWGMSMGGGVALMLAVTDDDFGTSKSGPYGGFSSRVQAVVDRYGPADLTSFPLDIPTALVMAFSLGTVDPNSPQLRLASPLSHVHAGAAPVLALHGRDDKIVPFRQSELFCEAMRKAGVPVKLYEIQGAGHAEEMDDRSEHRACNERCREEELTWFDRYLK